MLEFVNTLAARSRVVCCWRALRRSVERRLSGKLPPVVFPECVRKSAREFSCAVQICFAYIQSELKRLTVTRRQLLVESGGMRYTGSGSGHADARDPSQQMNIETKRGKNGVHSSRFPQHECET